MSSFKYFFRNFSHDIKIPVTDKSTNILVFYMNPVPPYNRYNINVRNIFYEKKKKKLYNIFS